MKILFLSQYFPPEMGAPQARISELALRLQESGHEVSILTAMPNYPTGMVLKAYQGLRTIEEEYQGLKVLRCWIYPSKSKRILPRLANYFSFVISSMFYGSKLGKMDVIIVESPPLFLGIAGIYLSYLLKAKMIFNVSDLWPSSAVDLGVISDGILVNLAEKLEKYCYHKSTAITGQSPTIVQTIKDKMPGKRVELISNGVDITAFSPSKKCLQLREKYDLKGKIAIVYAGLFGIAQDLGQILDVAAQLKEIKEIVFLLIGDGPEKNLLEKRVKDEGLDNVKLIPFVAKSEIPKILATMDVAIIPLKTAIKGAVPSKIYEAMASGLPIIFVGQGDGANIIEKANAGLVVNPGDKEALFKCVEILRTNLELRQELSKNGVKTATDLYSRDCIAERFNALLNEI